MANFYFWRLNEDSFDYSSNVVFPISCCVEVGLSIVEEEELKLEGIEF